MAEKFIKHTGLVVPLDAAAAVTGHFADIRNIK